MPVPYRWHLVGMLILILLTTGMSFLLKPADHAGFDSFLMPYLAAISRWFWLALALLALPLLSGGLSVVNRRLNAHVGEGVIFDLRMALYSSSAAHVAALLHQHPGRRADEPPEQ